MLVFHINKDTTLSGLVIHLRSLALVALLFTAKVKRSRKKNVKIFIFRPFLSGEFGKGIKELLILV